MINNRQGGRRRGRGGQRPQNMGGQTGGNRQDNRQRGNAAQLLEKYKSMARDAQLAGDRVQTEYYLQYAEHYFRILGESRARFEEQRRQRGEDIDDDENDEDLIEADGDGQLDSEERQDGGQRGDRPQQRGDRNRRFSRDEQDGDDRGQRGDRNRRFSRDEKDGDDSPHRGDRSGRSAGNEDDEDERPVRNGASRRGSNNGEGISVDILPPAIGRDDSDIADEEESPRPRRRARRPRAAEGDGEIAPAA